MTGDTAARTRSELDSFDVQALLWRADELQEETASVIADLDLLAHLGRHVEVVRNPTTDPTQERRYVVLLFEAIPGAVWKIDISFWLTESKGFQTVETEQFRRRLDDETRLAILWIKDIWRVKPEYLQVVGGVDIYRAVLDHGVRTPAEFGRFLDGTAPGKQSDERRG